MEFREWFLVNEVLDQPVPYAWVDPNKTQAIFEINYKTYEVIFIQDGYNAEAPWEVNFRQTKPKLTYGITGSGDAGQIMATVMKAIEEFKTIHNPSRVTFASYHRSRTKLYNKIIDRYAKKLGYGDVKREPYIGPESTHFTLWQGT